MPIYEYRCNACNHEFEELVRSDRQKVQCPSCGSARIARRPSVFGAVVAGASSGESCDSCEQCDSCDEGPCGRMCDLGGD